MLVSERQPARKPPNVTLRAVAKSQGNSAAEKLGELAGMTNVKGRFLAHHRLERIRGWSHDMKILLLCTPACLSNVAGNYTGGGKWVGKVMERKSDGNQEADKRCGSHDSTIPPSPRRVCSLATRIVDLTFLLFRNTSHKNSSPSKSWVQSVIMKRGRNSLHISKSEDTLNKASPDTMDGTRPDGQVRSSKAPGCTSESLRWFCLN